MHGRSYVALPSCVLLPQRIAFLTRTVRFDEVRTDARDTDSSSIKHFVIRVACALESACFLTFICHPCGLSS